jgi:hypothetical protein
MTIGSISIITVERVDFTSNNGCRPDDGRRRICVGSPCSVLRGWLALGIPVAECVCGGPFG